MEDREYVPPSVTAVMAVCSTVHCENGDILDVRREVTGDGRGAEGHSSILYPGLTQVEHEAVSRMLDMARLLEAPVYIVHTSTTDTLEEIRKAKGGVKAFCETCPQYLFLTEEKYHLPGFKAPNTRRARSFAAGKMETLCGGNQGWTVEDPSTDHAPSFY